MSNIKGFIVNNTSYGLEDVNAIKADSPELTAKADANSVYTKTQTDNLLDDKVDKVSGKSLSTNDYTNADKSAVDTISSKANASDVYTKTQVDSLIDTVETSLGNKVDKVTGKGLSTNDYSNADKSIVDSAITSVKTINGESIVGSGNITTSAGSVASVSGEKVSFTGGTALINDSNASLAKTYSSSKIESLIGGGGGGTTVVVNPILSGDEETATSIKVGDEKYVFPNTNTYGFTPAQITMFEGILRAAVYSSDQSSAITAFIASLNEQPVAPKVLTSITATKTKTNYYTDESFSTADVVVTAHYSDSTTATVTSGATIGTVDITSAGTKSLSISYSEGGVTKTTSISIVAEVRPSVKTLSSITASVTNTSVNQGETYSPQGLSVTAYYSDDTNADVTSSASVGTIDTSSAGNKTLTVSYTEDGVTKTYGITIEVVAPVVLSSISATKTKTSYEVGETFSNADVVVTAHYSDSSTANVTASATIGTVDTSTSGSKTLSISYSEDGVTKTTTIAITVAEAPSVTFAYKYGKRTQADTSGNLTAPSKGFACTIGSTDTSAPLLADTGVHAIPRGSIAHYSYSGTNTKIHQCFYTEDNGATWHNVTTAEVGNIPSTATHLGVCIISNDGSTAASEYSSEIESGLTLS